MNIFHIPMSKLLINLCALPCRFLRNAEVFLMSSVNFLLCCLPDESIARVQIPFHARHLILHIYVPTTPQVDIYWANKMPQRVVLDKGTQVKIVIPQPQVGRHSGIQKMLTLLRVRHLCKAATQARISRAPTQCSREMR